MVLSVEDPPPDVRAGVDPGSAARIVWYVSGRGVCRPAVYHLDERAGVWVRGASCESVVDGGVVVQPTFGGRVEVRLVHLKFDGTEAESPWTINYRLLPG
ncbi:MAG: hypothetical protein Q8P41_13280 [Pseudomonadota bacterium]|nr:hypothetical protein [Pseudomonadota bacterium]